MCLMMVGVNAWAAPGDEITSPSDVVSGKSYYIKGVYTSSKVDYTVYYGPTDGTDTDVKVSTAPVTDIDKALPITFTKVTDGWTLTTPNGLYVYPHTSNGQSYLYVAEKVVSLVAASTKEGSNKGIKFGPNGDYYFQCNKTAAKLGGYSSEQYGITLIEAEETSGKTETSLSFGEGSPFTVNIGESFTAPTLTATPSSILSSVTYSSSNTSVAEVNSTTGAVTIKGLGTATIKAKYEGDDDYLASSAEYEIKVVDPDAITATFDLSTNQYGWDATNDGNVYFDGSTYTPAVEGDITLSVSGNVRMWGSTTSSLRLYADNAGSDPNIYSFGRGAVTLKAAEGYVITSVTFEGSSLTFNASVEAYNNPTWVGEANEITFEKGSNTPQIKAITVTYKLISTPEPTYTEKSLTLAALGEWPHPLGGKMPANFATFSSDKDVFIPGTDDETFTVSVATVAVAVNKKSLVLMSLDDENYVEEMEINGKAYYGGYYVPANTGVLLVGMFFDESTTTIPYFEVENVEVPEVAPGYNMLRPASAEKETDGSFKFYKLAYKDQSMDPASLGFYWGAENGGAFASPRGGTAYLAVPAAEAANVKGFSFVADDATAIKNVENKVQTNAVYNLAGQRVSSKNYKGIVIKNGKQMLNK